MATVSTAAGLQGWGCRGKSQSTPPVRTSFSVRGVSVTLSSAPIHGLWSETSLALSDTHRKRSRGSTRWCFLGVWHTTTPDTDEGLKIQSHHYSLLAGRSDRETFQKTICSDAVCERNMFENHHYFHIHMLQQKFRIQNVYGKYTYKTYKWKVFMVLCRHSLPLHTTKANSSQSSCIMLKLLLVKQMKICV